MSVGDDRYGHSVPPKKSRTRSHSALDLLDAAVGSVPGGSARPGQQAMTAAIAEAVESGDHLLVQAGTGTGKSLAYLAPALTVQGPVVISTATLALQAQLVDKDLPRIGRAVAPLLGREPTFALLKGRHHYVCLAKLEHSDEQDPQDALFDAGSSGSGVKWLGESGRLGKQIERIRDWAMESDTGDRDELDPGVDDTAWRMVSTPARECVGAAKCHYGPECFAELSRARAREADVVVTNHSLLSADMMAGRHIVPEHQLLIIDEAHELADRVSSAAQAELTPDAVDRTARAARPFVEGDEYQSLLEAADALTVGLAETPAGRITGPLPAALVEACTLLDGATRRALTRIGDIKAEDSDPVRKKQAKSLLDEASTTAQRLLEDNEHDVAWVEHEPRRGLVVAPLSVAGLLSEKLYEDRTVVATSATLTLGGKFETLARSLGLPVTAPKPGEKEQPASSGPGWKSLDVGSPFDYAKQGILYVAAHLPRPAASGLPDAAGAELLALVQALGGRTLGLFSSRRAAQQAAELLRAKTDLTVLLQGDEALPLLVRKFREDRNSCLLGVMSLWQGVDVPGDACQLVVIDRLPFPRPDEPLAAARSAAVDSSGGSGFAAVSVPIAAIRLAQGVGRLIRSTSDKGVVAVLDSRLESARGYGPFLRASLPPFWYTTKQETVLGVLKRLSAT
ncbi:ATP-dependent DNA helicase [Catellatospora sp. NPDC049609]|uniref:ATP-dependent DNA helicase n=1 Tax=Catellatospora sp. NPDC049609 TaxID=3155505 RepID=UPI00342A8C89